MTLLDQIDGMTWADPDTECFARLISGGFAPDLRPEAADLVVLAAAAWIIASRSATHADLSRLHAELHEVSADLRAFHGIQARRPPLRLVGGADA